MKTFNIRRVLIPTDFSETGLLAFEHGAFLARLCKADLYMLHVVEIADYAYTGYDPILVPPADMTITEDFAASKMEELASRVALEYGVHAIPLVSKGRVAHGIAEAVENHDIDIVVMGTHGAQGFGEIVMGSNAQKTVSSSTCPVITVQRHAKNLGLRNVVMPIDNTAHSRQKVDYVLELASHYAARIHILGLIDSKEDVDEKKFMIKIESIEKAVRRKGLTFTTKIVKGTNLAKVALAYSETNNADLIAVMRDHESHLNNPILETFSRHIVNHSRIPVMSVKPSEGPYEPFDLSADPSPY
jgi:nucleotide-binding universal stress UspA family protein